MSDQINAAPITGVVKPAGAEDKQPAGERPLGYKSLRGFAGALGIKFLSLGNGEGKVRLVLTDAHRNPMRAVHGAVLFAVADTVAGAAASSIDRTHTATLTSSCEFLQSTIESKELTAEAVPVKKEGRVVFYDVNVIDDRSVTVAHFNFSFYRIFRKDR